MNNNDETKYEKQTIVKELISYKLQVQKIKEKGFLIENDEECEKFLQCVNYYRF